MLKDATAELEKALNSL